MEIESKPYEYESSEADIDEVIHDSIVEICCPICFEELYGIVNIVTTECGHKYHTNCLMKSVAHNGFGCPYCRHQLAESVNDSDEDENEDDETSNDDDDDADSDDETVISIPKEENENYALRGMRFMYRRVENIPVLDEDEEDERQHVYQNVVPPSIEYILENLQGYNIDMEHLLCTILHKKSRWYYLIDAQKRKHVNRQLFHFTKNIKRMFDDYLGWE